MVMEVSLSQGRVALVSDEDYELVSQHSWYVVKKSRTMYAQRSFKKGGRWTTQQLHRFLMSPGIGEYVDHVDGDGLNNQRENLRLCSVAENNRNVAPRIDNKSGFKGVRLCNGRWRSEIEFEGTRKHLGMYDNPIDAAKAYDNAAMQHHGHFAWLNFPGGD